MDAAWQALRAGDAAAVELSSGGGAVLACPTITGRLFLRLGDDTLSRVDADMARRSAPADGSFHNVGGCSLWPAPEGGAYGFNYPDGGDWCVQEGVNVAPYRVAWRSAAAVVMEKTVTLVNRAGRRSPVVMRRQVSPSSPPGAEDYADASTGYAVQDAFIPAGDVPFAETLLMPWTLEQFPLAPGMEIFVCARPGWRVNWDYYPAPADTGRYDNGMFRKNLVTVHGLDS